MEIKADKKSGFTTSDEQPHERPHREISKRAALEGIVLLENKENVLPLEKGAKIALYGQGVKRTIKGGTGSGDVNERSVVSVYEGMKEAGFRIVNEDWIDKYEKEYESKRIEWRDSLLKSVRESTDENENFFEMYAAKPFPAPAGEEPGKEDTDTAIYVLSRTSGEAADRRNAKGDYYLTDEEEKFLDDLCRLYDKVIVILNSGGVMDLSFMDTHKNILGLIFMGQAGMEGGSAIAEIMSGEVSPSGHLTDTWCYDYEDYPGALDFSFMNEDLTTERYEEGIYVGYRYFDSLQIPVRYGFGYGLTYSEFIFDAAAPEYDNGIISIPVNITNIGDVPAKEVLQVYVSCPQNGLEKELRRLAGFHKTQLIPSGGTEKAVIKVSLESLTSYDADAPGWILEKGTYGIWAGFSLERSVLTSVFELSDSVITEKTENICGLQDGINEFSIPEEDRMELFDKWINRAKDEELPCLSIDTSGIGTRTCVYGRDDNISDDIRNLVDSLSDDKLISLLTGALGDSDDGELVGSSGFQVAGGAGDTSYLAVDDGIPSIVTADGPAGLRLQEKYIIHNGAIKSLPFIKTVEHGFFDVEAKEEPVDGEIYYQYCTAFPVGTLLASTWDTEMVCEVGRAVAEEMNIFGVSLWLAPGMNIHRNPLCGRNFEYYSEDPRLSGVMAAAMTKGVQSIRGCGTTIKHYACNNSEDNRYFSNSIVSERALREIYLKGFEIAVKGSQPKALMTSYNKVNGIHSANNYDLITKVLRDEWGFGGLVMTDWTTTWHGDNCTARGCVRAGNDLIMPGHSDDQKEIRESLESGLLTRDEVLKCAYRVVRTVKELKPVSS